MINSSENDQFGKKPERSSNIEANSSRKFRVTLLSLCKIQVIWRTDCQDIESRFDNASSELPKLVQLTRCFLQKTIEKLSQFNKNLIYLVDSSLVLTFQQKSEKTDK